LRTLRSRIILFFLLLFLIFSSLLADKIQLNLKTHEGRRELLLSNDQIECSIVIDKENLISDTVKAQPQWLEKFASTYLTLVSDADFRLDITWSGWKAPGKINNADNQVSFSKKDFRFKGYQKHSIYFSKAAIIPLSLD